MTIFNWLNDMLVNDMLVLQFNRAGLSLFSTTTFDLLLHRNKACWTTFLFSVHVLFSQQWIKVIMVANIFENLVCARHLSKYFKCTDWILIPWPWVSLSLSHFIDTETKHPEVQGPACLYTLSKRERQDLNQGSWFSV